MTFTWSVDWVAVANAFTAIAPNVLGAYLAGWGLAIIPRLLLKTVFPNLFR